MQNVKITCVVWTKLLTSHYLDVILNTNRRHKEVQMQAYCMKCRRKVEIKNPKAIRMKNKRPATQGVCPRCGTKVFRIGK
jgi:DNA-directed RNA polymerase subunit RPC12/RpoP